MKRIITCFFVLFYFQGHSQSSFLALWDFDCTCPDGTINVTTATASNAAFGSGVSGITYYTGNPSSGEAYAAESWTTSTAVNSNDYFEVCVNAVSPYVFLKNKSVTYVFDYRRSNTGPTSAEIRVSTNNFTTYSLVTTVALTTTSFKTITPVSYTFPNNSTSVCFRAYAYNAGAAGGTLRFDNVKISGNQALPVRLTSLTANAVNSKSVISFSTATEENNDYFEIERASDGIEFFSIGEVKGAGTTTSVQNYRFTDETPLSGTNYYRLKQVDFDGQFTYSPVVTVQFDGPGGFRLFPVPVKNQLQLQLDEPDAFESQWTVYNALGQLVLSGVLPEDQSSLDLNVSDLAPGMYWLQRTSGRARNSRMFVKE